MMLPEVGRIIIIHKSPSLWAAWIGHKIRVIAHRGTDHIKATFCYYRDELARRGCDPWSIWCPVNVGNLGLDDSTWSYWNE